MYAPRKDDGGLHTLFFDGYKPQFYVRAANMTGAVTLPEDVEMVMPVDNTHV